MMFPSPQPVNGNAPGRLLPSPAARVPQAARPAVQWRYADPSPATTRSDL